MSGSQPRLGYQIDTSGLVNAKAAQDALMASGVRLGQAADNAALKVSQVGKDTHGQLQTATNDVVALERALNAAKDAADKAKKALPPNWTQMTQGGRTAWTFNNQGAWGELTRSQQEVERLSKTLADARSQSSELGGAMDVAAGRASFMGGAFGAVAGILAFQFVGAVASAVAELARIPLESARAADAVLMLDARMRFAFRGSAEAARQARDDIHRIADDAGRLDSDVGGEYADIAIAGRSAGLTRAQVSGLTSSFSTLGMISGADSNRIGRALWQVQQGIAVGRLTYQDYRLASASLPALDDALGAGLGVDPSRIPGMISRGEINTERLVLGLTRGVEILARDADAIPETMERASNRLKNQWDRLMTHLGQSLETSQFFQSLSRLAAANVRGVDAALFGSDEDRLAELRSRLANANGVQRSVGGAAEGLGLRTVEQEIAELERRIASRPSKSASMAAVAALEAEGVRNAAVGQARTEALNFDPMGAARADLNNRLDLMRRGLANATDPADIEEIRLGISRAQAQLSQIMTGFARALMEARQAEQDLAQYGAANFDVISRARSIVSSAASEGNPIGMESAVNLVMRQRLTGAEGEAARGAAQLAGRQGVVDAAGGSVTERRRAQIQYETDGYAAQFGDTRLNGDPELASRAGALILQFRNNRAQQFAQDDVQALRERERMDNERLETLRAQIQAGIQLGQQGRIALAQAERERDLRRNFPAITEELIAAERVRVGELIRANDQLALQQEQMNYLVDAAQTAGSAITSALRHGIIEGARTGSLRAADFFNVLEDSALRVADRIMAAFLSPYEKQAAGFLENLMGNIPGLSGIMGSNNTVSIGPMITAEPISAGGAAPARMMRADSPKSVSSGMTVNVIDQRGGDAEAVETQERTGPDGERILDVMIRDKVKGAIASGQTDKAMQSRFGASRQIRRR